jgi:hypothetical protein
VAHGDQKERDALLAGPDMGGFFGHLGHSHRILCGVDDVDGRRVQVQLVARHEHQVPNFFALRQAPEQYFTWSQVLAQRLRQVMVRPQAAQSLLGRDCLLPLNEAGGMDRN